ncbi:MAG: hypothetical protein MRY74_14955 [Neomegalonema sp.]|nr:hypothetical protein [Neomegalonema sp.]
MTLLLAARLLAARRSVSACIGASLLALAPLGADAFAQTGIDSKPRSVIPWMDKALTGDGPTDGAIASTPRVTPKSEPATATTPASGEPSATDGAAKPTGAPLPPRLDISAPVDGEEDDPTKRTPLPKADPKSPTTVEVAELSKLNDGSAGLITAKDLGLPIEAWSKIPLKQAIELTTDFEPTRLRSANALAIRLLLTAFEAPRPGAAATGKPDPSEPDYLTARLDALMRYGAADAAARLAAAAGGARVAKAAEPALVARREKALCRALLDPSERGSLPRIYCQILADDTAGALVAIEASRALGETDEVTLGLLEAMADSAYLELAAPPKEIAELSPLRLAAMRRLKLPIPANASRAAPLSILPAIIDEKTSPRQRLEALERLERSGAVETAKLAAAYKEATSAESGGVWGRVEAFRKAITAPAEAFPARAAAALARATVTEQRDMMARLLGDALLAYAKKTLADGSAAEGAAGWTQELRDALRLAGHGDTASALLRANPLLTGVEERVRDRIAARDFRERWDAAKTAPLIARAVRGELEAGRMLAALDAFGVPIADPTLFADETEIAFVEPGQKAALAFEAIKLLAKSKPISSEALHGAVTRLVAIGLVDEARQIAIEAVLSSR